MCVGSNILRRDVFSNDGRICGSFWWASFRMLALRSGEETVTASVRVIAATTKRPSCYKSGKLRESWFLCSGVDILGKHLRQMSVSRQCRMGDI